MKYNLDDQLKPIAESYLYDKIDYSVLCEDEKTKFAGGVVTALFGDIKKKMFKSDFSETDRTKGDFTKHKSYKAIGRALNFLDVTAKEQVSNDLGYRVDVLKETYSILNSHKEIFKNGYAMGNDFIIVTYNSMANSLIVGTSEAISMAAEYLQQKDARNNIRHTRKTYQFKSKHITGLEDLNKLARNGKLREIGDKLLVKKESPAGVILYTQAFIAAVIIVLKSVKCMVFTYYHSRIKAADHLRNIAEYVEMKSDRTMDKSVKAKQLKWIENLKAFADKVDVDAVRADIAAQKAIDESNSNMSELPTEWLL